MKTCGIVSPEWPKPPAIRKSKPKRDLRNHICSWEQTPLDKDDSPTHSRSQINEPSPSIRCHQEGPSLGHRHCQDSCNSAAGLNWTPCFPRLAHSVPMSSALPVTYVSCSRRRTIRCMCSHLCQKLASMERIGFQ